MDEGMGIFASHIWLTLFALAFLTQGGLILFSYRVGFQNSTLAERGLLPPAGLRTYSTLGWSFLLAGLVLVAMQAVDMWRLLQG
ncbi:MAG: hypothetical protein EB121_07170 [Alphaproteobacteria bacterium]|nr:hypothetical protein [Alphaproteobacteria bacterium]NDG05107.1 hypothetical protein [Alphaproteobacteria bacterium]